VGKERKKTFVSHTQGGGGKEDIKRKDGGGETENHATGLEGPLLETKEGKGPDGAISK